MIFRTCSAKKVEYIEKTGVNPECVHAYTDYKEMLEKEDIDVVTIATERWISRGNCYLFFMKKEQVLW